MQTLRAQLFLHTEEILHSGYAKSLAVDRYCRDCRTGKVHSGFGIAVFDTAGRVKGTGYVNGCSCTVGGGFREVEDGACKF